MTTTVNFGLFATSYAGAVANDSWVVRTNPSDATRVQVLINGNVTYTAPYAILGSKTLAFGFFATGESLTVDNTYGTALPSGGATFTGNAANDSLNVIGTSGSDTFINYSGSINVGGRTITYSNAATVSEDPKGGTDSIYVNSGTVHIPAQTAGAGLLTRTFSTLSVSGSAALLADSAAAATDRTVYVANSSGALSVDPAGKLDLGANDLIVKGGSLLTVSNLVKSGYAAGQWNGNGLISAAAKTNGNALGVLQNGSTYTTFDNVSVAGVDILVAYTLYGDTNLNRAVDITDFNNFAPHFGQASGGTWASGDFNFDGAIDISDFNILAPKFGLSI